MPSSNRRKGFQFERDLVNQARARNLPAERAYGSNGKALGEVEECDLRIGSWRIQAKIRKSLGKQWRCADGVDATAFREDRGDAFILLRFDDFLEMLCRLESDGGSHAV